MYCPLCNENKEHLTKLIAWIFDEVVSAGGDGDAMWYSKYYDVKEILDLVHEFNDNLQCRWTINFNENERTISWSDNQEYILITNNEEIYKNAPSWQQCIVVN